MVTQSTGTATAEDRSKVQTRESVERENVERSAAVAGAQAVADSVKRAADAAIEGAKAQSLVGVPGDFLVTGTAGGRFELRAKAGPIFSSSGSVFVGGRPQTIHEWGADYIRGRFDDGVKTGDEVVVPIDEKTKRVGYVK